MKIFLSLCFSILAISSYAKVSPPIKLAIESTIESQKKELVKNENVGRECCEQGGYDSNGTYVVVEACAGWFLSNSTDAHDRACDKALAALSAIISNP